MNKQSKKDKVTFILSCRAEREKALKHNDAFYQSLFEEYMNSEDDNILNEFNFYINK